MKTEFIPAQFTESDGECTICDARKELERSLGEESDHLLRLGTDLMFGTEQGCKGVSTPAVFEAYLRLCVALGDAVADYRVCFAQNLALFFTAERHGRLRKVPEFLGACDEYRERALASLADFDSAFEVFKDLAKSMDVDELECLHTQTLNHARSFWQQIERWSEERYKTARSLFAKVD